MHGDMMFYCDAPYNNSDVLAGNSLYQVPSTLAFHQSALIGEDFLILVGGRTADCPASDDLLMLDIKCSTWLLLDTNTITGKLHAGLLLLALVPAQLSRRGIL